jgi:hypothetical protein
MRTVAWLLMPALALLLLAAHFLHAGFIPLAVLPILLLGLLAVRRSWAARTLQLVLALGAIEWVLTAWTLTQTRLQHDQPWVRLVAILGTVALFTACAALVFQWPALRARYQLGGSAIESPPATG